MIGAFRFGALIAAFCAGAVTPALAEKTIVMPNSFRAYQLDAVGSSELEPDWTAAARANLDRAMAEVLDGASNFDIGQFPELSGDERAIVDEHIALFEANALAAVEMIHVARVEAKKTNPAYTVGPGLAFLAERGIADKAVVLTGSQQWSTGGRKFLMVLGAAAGAYVSTGSSGLLVGFVELRTGDIVWMNYMNPITGGDVREAEKTASVLRTLVSAYPGGKLYRSRD